MLQRTSLHRQGMKMLKPDFHPQLCSFIYTAHVIKAQILISCPRVFGSTLCSGGLKRSPLLPNWPELGPECASGRQEPTRPEPIGTETGEKSRCYSSFLHNVAV